MNFKKGDKIKFKGHPNEYYADDYRVEDYYGYEHIIHGNRQTHSSYKKTGAEIVHDCEDGWFIVRYLDKTKKHVQLAFEGNSLELIEPNWQEMIKDE